MAFKINVSDKGKTLKLEIETESLIRSKIGDKVKGESFAPDLEGYELEITGSSDSSGFPGIKGNTGGHLRKILLRKGDKGMNNKRKGIRLKKSVRGEEISEKTVQINMKVIKEGNKKFEDLLPKKEAEESAVADKSKEGEEKKEEGAEKPAEAPKKEAKPETPTADEQEAKEPAEEPKPVAEETEQAAQPEQEPKSKESEKEELSNPDEEPKA